MAYPDNKGVLDFETVANIIPPNTDISIKSLSLILNSKFIGWFVYNLIYNKAIRDMDFDAFFVKRIILPNQMKIKILDNISEYLCYLNSDEDMRKIEEQSLAYLDTMIADSLIYEIYLKDKFVEEGAYSDLKNDLASLLEKNMPKIDYNGWSALHWKKKLGKGLSPDDEEKLRSLEKDNLEIIRSTYEKLSKNEEINDLIGRIKSNDWIKLIEGK